MYFVIGGIYKDFRFDIKEIVSFEDHGGFETYEEAYDVWKKHVWLNVDNALHRLRIIKE